MRALGVPIGPISGFVDLVNYKFVIVSTVSDVLLIMWQKFVGVTGL